VRCPLRIPEAEGFLPQAGEVLELVGVDPLRVQDKAVAGRTRDQRLLGPDRREPLTQAGDVSAQGDVGAGRRCTVPQLVDEATRRHELVQVHQQHREEVALSRPPDVDRQPVVADDQERTEDAEARQRVRRLLGPAR
jgi:hypothetical protein